MRQDNTVENFEQQANYTMLSLLVYKTITSVSRFKNVPKDAILAKIYASIKSRAADK